MSDVESLQQQLADTRETLEHQARELEQLRFFRELVELKLDGGQDQPEADPQRMQELESELLSTKQELAHWQEKYRATVDNIAVAVLVADYETAYITEANKAACILFGYSIEEFRQKTGRDLSPNEEEVHAEVHALSRDINSTGRGYHPRLPMKRHDGGRIYCEVRGQVFEVGGKEYLLSILTDVTHKDQDPESVAAEVTHTLLRGFSLHVDEALHESERALGRLELTSEPRPELARVRKALARLRRSVLDVRHASGQLDLDVEQIEVRDLFDQAIRTALPRLKEAGIAIRGRYAPDTPAVFVDRSALRRVFSSLIAWSAQRMKHTSEPRLEVGARHGGDVVEARVWHNGPTLTVDRIRSLFTPFAHPAGLKLAAARGLVEAHGGELNVTQDDSRGGVAMLVRIPLD